ncbi:ROK family transcriptional regulator [Spirochaetia bacterium 38H-sp]|uniref:ROK family transcriptional regulator n=1 Tax=Rarispira pelagica TaxID=3141764 RepID=A0ABU9UBQ4_9SPIR
MIVRSIKLHNKNKILKVLAKKGSLTKQDIALETGMSLPTVATNVDELVKEGYAKEAGMGESRGGRRPVVVEFVPDARFSVGIEVRPGKLIVVLTDLYASIRDRAVSTFPVTADGVGIKASIESAVRGILDKNSIPYEKVMGLGISLPGVCESSSLLLEFAPNLGISNLSFEDFKKHFHFPIYIENEAKAAALAEFILSEDASASDSVLYISVTEGIGSGLILSGNVYRGASNRAGEIGHITIMPDGRQCGCGKKGCWERYASVSALIDDYCFEKRSDDVSIASFSSDLERGDRVAVSVWKEYVSHLAMGIHSAVLMVDPAFVFVGGEIAVMGDRLISDLNDVLMNDSSLCEDRQVRIELARLGNDASALGAALMALSSFPLYS